MRTFIKNYIDAKKRQKLDETGEEGFSLIELIIVVVILGILVAIAIPVFLGIQSTAEDNALKTAAANGATAAASAIVAKQDVAAAAASAGSGEITVKNVGSTSDVSKVCATATGYGTKSFSAGPGCAAATP